MSTRSIFKWTLSIILGGILLVLALIGGNWGTSYTANAGMTDSPEIDYIIPSEVPTGSGEVMLIISGSYFGDVDTFIKIWLKDQTGDYGIDPYNVYDTMISVKIPPTFFTTETTYLVKVIKSNGQSTPPAPPNLIYDLVSNGKDLVVYVEKFTYLPLVSR